MKYFLYILNFYKQFIQMTLNVIEFLLYIINIACFPFFKYDKSSNININIKQTKHCVVLLQN